MTTKAWLERLKGRRHGRLTVIDRRELPEGKCELCRRDGEELRPYGAKGEWICFECGTKDEKTTARRFREVVFGEREH